jgi:hypothetical protein
MMEDLQQPTPTPERDTLFVRERSMTPIQLSIPVEIIELDPALALLCGEPVDEEMPVPPSPVQVAITEQMLIPPSSVITPEKVDTAESEVTPPFVQKLRDLEDNARAEMAAWDPKYRGLVTEESSAAAGASLKRKGITLNPSGAHFTNSTTASEMDSDCSDDEDEAVNDEDDDEVPPFDPNSQERPKLPIYHPGFKLTEELALGTLQVFADFLKVTRANGYHDEEAAHLWNEIMRSIKIPYRDAVKLAVAGETGAGKSALLNALLGVLNLTIEVRIGLECIGS